MRKAVLKRIKITKTGKLLRRGSGQNHFNAKESRRAQMRKKSTRGLYPATDKRIRAYINQ